MDYALDKGIKTDGQAVIDIENDEQEKKNTGITFMIKSSVQFN